MQVLVGPAFASNGYLFRSSISKEWIPVFPFMQIIIILQEKNDKLQIVNQTHSKPTKSRHKKLLVDPDVKRWYQNIARGSTMTDDVRLRRLGVYCERTDTTPKELAQIGIDIIRKVDKKRVR